MWARGFSFRRGGFGVSAFRFLLVFHFLSFLSSWTLCFPLVSLFAMFCCKCTRGLAQIRVAYFLQLRMRSHSTPLHQPFLPSHSSGSMNRARRVTSLVVGRSIIPSHVCHSCQPILVLCVASIRPDTHTGLLIRLLTCSQAS